MKNAFHTSGTSPTDFHIASHGNIFILLPLSPAVNSWVEENLPCGYLRSGHDVSVLLLARFSDYPKQEAA